MTNKSGPNYNTVILKEEKNIITDHEDIYETLDKFVASVAKDIGFPYGFPVN